ncbi:MAG: hypothetical protein ACJ796_05670 [Gemmatimonadaceae bacterium]|jgi:hypothetical protein
MPNVGHVANIDDRGAARRRTGGIVWLVIAIAAAVAMVVLHARDGWYALLVIPFAMAALGYFQARERT